MQRTKLTMYVILSVLAVTFNLHAQSTVQKGDFTISLATYDHYKIDGFKHLAYIEIPGVGHSLAGPGWFEKGIVALDADRSPVMGAIAQKTAAPQIRKSQKFSPGEIVHVEAPKAKNSFLVYVPTNYTPEFPWPVIFCYPDKDQLATTEPFNEITHGEGFIIVGMNYATEAFHQRLSLQRTGPEKAFFAEVLDIVSSHLSVDRTMVFMGGQLHGGAATSILGEQLVDELAGFVILGTGRALGNRFPYRKPIHGKPIFIGVGKKTRISNRRAKKAVRLYQDWGAKVTFEEWEDVEWRFGRRKSAKLLKWLRENGPLKDVASKFAMARAAENAGALGEAFARYHQLATTSETDAYCIEAAKAMEKLSHQAESQLAQVEKSIGNKSYASVTKQLRQIAQTYDGSVFGVRAHKYLKELVNTKADELENRARAAEKAKDYKKALQLYKLYLTHYKEADRYPEVKASYNSLRTKAKN